MRMNQAQRKAAATRLQNWLRFLTVHWAAQHSAATILAKTRVLRDRIQIWNTDGAALTLTCWAKARLVAKKYGRKLRAARKLQAWIRAILTRRSLALRLLEEPFTLSRFPHEIAVLGPDSKGRLTRTTKVLEKKAIPKAEDPPTTRLLKLEALVTSAEVMLDLLECVTRIQSHQHWRIRVRACKRIQASFRAVRVRRRLVPKRVAASVSLQCMVRIWRARRRTCRRRHAVLKLQSIRRALLARRRVRRLQLERYTIQEG